MQGNAYELQGGNCLDFLLLARHSERAVLFSVPFYQLRKRLFLISEENNAPKTTQNILKINLTKFSKLDPQLDSGIVISKSMLSNLNNVR